MHILFSADWHIKLGQKNVPRKWQKDRFHLMFDKLHELEKDVELNIVGGDVFDKVPNLEELELFFEYVKGCTIETIIYDGNHEATKKGHTFLTQLQKVVNGLNPLVKIVTSSCSIYNMDFLPYTELKTFKPEDFSNRILYTHVRGEIPPHVSPEIDLNKLKRWDLVVAGDLHAHSNSQRNILYPGSPLTTSFHRKEVKTGVVILDSETLEYDWINLELPQLLRKTVETEKEMIKTNFHHTIYEITGDLLSLAGLDLDNELLDKKIVNRNTEATLNLKDMSIEEELFEYLQNVQSLDTDKIENILGVFNDLSKDA
jgi:DNA repair exonuclease SbcCD nuclease subunit